VKVVPADRIAECADVVDAGGIVAIPTRRWYMLCADSTNALACQRLFAGKGRPPSKPLALVMPSNESVAALFTLSEQARGMAEGLWPGDLALLLPWARAGQQANRWWLGGDTAMVTRDPGLLGDLARRTRNPPAATVASRSDGEDAAARRPALSPAQVRDFVAQTGTPVDILVDGGVCPLDRGLTVVDCSRVQRVTREGAVSVRAIMAVLSEAGLTDDELAANHVTDIQP
jgi:L-threonylcarbamoyladenylate synthase